MDEKKVEQKEDVVVKTKKALPEATLSTATTSKPVVVVTKTVKQKKSKPVIADSAPKAVIVSNPLVSSKELDKRLKSIETELGKVSHSFIKVASCIYWIYGSDSFKTLGFDNIYDFAKNKFDIARGTCNGFINIMIRFGKRDFADCIIEEIADKYKDYKSTQLLVMLDIDDADLEKITPKMTVREIKAFKKSLELPSKSEVTEDVSDHDSSDSSDCGDSDDNSIIDVISKDVNRQTLITIKDFDDYKKHLDTIDTLILNTLNNKSHAFKIEIVCSYE